MIRVLFRLPNNNPVAATILTGLVSIGFIAWGISNFQSGWVFLLVGLCLSICITFAAYETGGFRTWTSTSPVSAIARWAGSLVLSALVLWLDITLRIAFFLIRMLGG